MSDTLPMFPLNTVLFPGMSVPLQVFEDRYRALVHHLLRVEDPTERVFGSVGIREGYEVGEHGAQWLFRVGCRVKMTEVESYADGTFELVAVGLDRIELERLDTSGVYPVGQVTRSPSRTCPCRTPSHETARPPTRPTATCPLQMDREPPSGELPRDPAYLSWALAARSPLRSRSGRRCWRPRTPGAAADGHRGDPRRAADDAGVPVVARHRDRPDPLVTQLSRQPTREGRALRVGSARSSERHG